MIPAECARSSGELTSNTRQFWSLSLRQYSSDITFTPAVKGIQTDKGSRASYARMETGGSWESKGAPELEAFLADLDMFYLGTANAEGLP